MKLQIIEPKTVVGLTPTKAKVSWYTSENSNILDFSNPNLRMHSFRVSRIPA